MRGPRGIFSRDDVRRDGRRVQLEPILDLVAILFLALRNAPREDDKIGWHADAEVHEPRRIGIRSEDALGRLKLRKPSAGAEMKAIFANRDSRP